MEKANKWPRDIITTPPPAKPLLQPASGYQTTPAKPQRNTNTQSNTTHEITQQISRKLLRMDVLTSETSSAVNNEIKTRVTSSWSLFIQLSFHLMIFLKFCI